MARRPSSSRVKRPEGQAAQSSDQRGREGRVDCEQKLTVNHIHTTYTLARRARVRGGLTISLPLPLPLKPSPETCPRTLTCKKSEMARGAAAGERMQMDQKKAVG